MNLQAKNTYYKYATLFTNKLTNKITHRKPKEFKLHTNVDSCTQNQCGSQLVRI